MAVKKTTAPRGIARRCKLPPKCSCSARKRGSRSIKTELNVDVGSGAEYDVASNVNP